ncbi:hypothetical protein JL09_g2220 [Pichia kudriavzevii]|uniref:Uncharacterized protein n=1 Tax=Pichia kudriavzevii TaxID=4909 RepID=A0A099P3I8_PICKU|nr:hypothetical protein JL09_g2220 [Pichia kudriavzevii]
MSTSPNYNWVPNQEPGSLEKNNFGMSTPIINPHNQFPDRVLQSSNIEGNNNLLNYNFAFHSNLHGHKRPFSDAQDSPHNAKRRLVENLNELTLGRANMRGKTSGIFGNISKEQLKRPLTDPNKVIIQNIDQFLQENPEQLDIIGRSLQLDDLKKAGLDGLVVACGLDLKKVWTSIVDRYKNGGSSNKGVDDLIHKMIWDEYLAKYFSVIKHYDPFKVMWKSYVQWLSKKNKLNYRSHRITELDGDGDAMMMEEVNQPDEQQKEQVLVEDDLEFHDDEDVQNEMARLAYREQRLRDGMSNYGSYYTHEDAGHNLWETSHNQHHVEAYAQDDDVVMDD